MTAVVVGAGERGLNAFGAWFEQHPGEGFVVGVAEPDATRRDRFARRHELPPDACHVSWDELFDRPRFADVAVVATGDRHHVEPTLLALERGYHVLLEKPMALDEEDARRIVDAAESADRIVQVCHLYRYSAVFAALQRAVASGALGKVVTIQLAENVAFWHYAHSYVRGHTRNSEVPMLLQKSCHDLDLLHWLAGAPASRVTSLTRPTELTAANAPADAPEHCIEGCPHSHTCPYDAVETYVELTPLLHDLERHRSPPGLGIAAHALERFRARLLDVPIDAVRSALEWDRWPVSPVSDDVSRAGLEEALRTTRWGRCVYRIDDNDQPSSQTVDVRFTNDVLASFTMHSTSYRSGREFRVDGTSGTAVGHLSGLEGTLTLHGHKSGRRRRVRIPPTFDGHGGGESPLIADFLGAVRGEHPARSTAAEALESHRIAFAALRSADEGVAVDLDG
ncbi:MAG: Gfo/Idh/MocA family oxidoreductase [Acidimicrobiia bacterium]|nr:Gfo/Idh/MocA family oxidoreductase [Acidimicrobiia bacterium]